MLIIPGQMATPDAINFMARHGRGLICLAMTRSRIEHLGLPLMAGENGSEKRHAFTVSIEARDGVSTGISAADRARTVAVAIDATRGPEHIVTPGHVFPLMAQDGGVLVRAGHTEAAVDVSRLAGLNPSGVICQIMSDDGTVARAETLGEFARRHSLKTGTISSLIAYRHQNDRLVRHVCERTFDSAHGGRWTAKVYANEVDQSEILVLQKGEPAPDRPTLVRMHHVSLYHDMLEEDAPRTGILTRAMDIIGTHESGVIVLLREANMNVISDMVVGARPERTSQIRKYGIGAQILTDLGVRDVILLTNSNQTLVGLQGYGLNVVENRRI